MPNDLLKEFSITDTEAYKGLAESQGWWVCSTCGAHFPTSIPASADDGVTQCSSCMNVKILSAIIPAHLKCLVTALKLLRGFKELYLCCPGDCYLNLILPSQRADLLLHATALLEETSLLLMHWEKDIPHA
jgi:hypothetical protein